MISIRHIQADDKEFWFRLDKHLSEAEFDKKVSNKRGYVLLENGNPIGLLRYNLFWDNIPFCTMLFIDWEYQHKGFGRILINYLVLKFYSNKLGEFLRSAKMILN